MFVVSFTEIPLLR